jgi:hypothetical protein
MGVERRRRRMRRGFTILIVVVLVLAGIGIGVAAWNAGVDHGVQQQLAESGREVQVVRVVGDRVGPGWGFFPFGFLFFPMFVFGMFALFRVVFWRARWGGPGRGPWRGPGGPWPGQVRERFDEWHREEHHETGSGAERPPP